VKTPVQQVEGGAGKGGGKAMATRLMGGDGRGVGDIIWERTLQLLAGFNRSLTLRVGNQLN
jgi:hypothetical protein